MTDNRRLWPTHKAKALSSTGRRKRAIAAEARRRNQAARRRLPRQVEVDPCP